MIIINKELIEIYKHSLHYTTEIYKHYPLLRRF